MEGITIGWEVGILLGCFDGWKDGSVKGCCDGFREGKELGDFVGRNVGSFEGFDEG